MNYNDEYIVKLCKSSIFDKTPEKPEVVLGWDYIYNKSVEQNIAGLLFTTISKLDAEFQPDKGIMTKWKTTMISTISVMSSRYNEFLRMNKLMQDNGITLIGLKGCVIRNLYPVPELRTMGDFDVLANKSDLANIVEIFSKNGYKVKNDAFGIVCENQKAYWEIFTTIEEEMRTEPDKWDMLFLKNVKITKNVCRLKGTYFLIHLIVHTGKHCLREGSGIRNLCDIALYINENKKEIDFETVKTACKEQKVWNIYIYIINAVKQFFDVDISGINIPEKDSEQFVEYMMLNGVFGKQGNVIVPQAAKHEDDSIGGLRKILFPTVKMLDYRYKYLKKYPLLLPVAWIQRIFSAFFRCKYSFRQMAGDMKEAIEFSKDRIKWLNELKLIDKE